jgi:hypothetical protein
MAGHEQDYIFIAWAYIGVAVVTIGLVAAIWLASRRAKLRLAALEAQGIRRRSGGSAA